MIKKLQGLLSLPNQKVFDENTFTFFFSQEDPRERTTFMHLRPTPKVEKVRSEYHSMLNQDLELDSGRKLARQKNSVLKSVESAEDISNENRIKLAGLKRQLDRTVSRVAELKTISFTNKNMSQSDIKSALASGDYTNHKVTRNTIEHFN